MITVITVCFNAVTSIEKTILSVLGQSYPYIEYIVVDGGSTDGTKDLIQKYADKLSHYVSEPDNGIYDAMNKGLSLAGGEWVTFRNSGDCFVSPDAISLMFDKPVDDSVAVLHGDCIYIKDNIYVRKKPSILTSSYLDGMPVLHPASFIRTGLHKAHPFDLQYKFSGDYDFFYHCCQRGDVFEYRPVAVAEFEVGGAASRNLPTTFLEDCRIKGNICGFEKQIRYVFISIKTFLVIISDKVPVLSSLRDKSLVRRGWKSLPYDLKA